MKKKLNLLQIQANNEKAYYVIKNGIKIYPISEFEYFEKIGRDGFTVLKNKKWLVESDNNGTITTYKKLVSESELNEMIAKTINYYYNKLKENENKN